MGDQTMRFASGGVTWEVRPTETGIQVYMAPSAGGACAVSVVPVSGNVINVSPARSEFDARRMGDA